MDQLFVRFAQGLFLVMLLFGAAMTLVILIGDKAIGLRMLTIFGSMFAGVLGLGSGYLLGRGERKIKENGEEGA